MKGRVAVVLGRFQPFHIGHWEVFDYLRYNGYNKVAVLLGEQGEGDPLTYGQRATFFSSFLEDKFDEYWLGKVYNNPNDDEKFVKDSIKSLKGLIGTTRSFVFAKPQKPCDIVDGYNYLDLYDKYATTIEVPVTDVHASDIRREPDKYLHNVHPKLRSRFLREITKGGQKK